VNYRAQSTWLTSLHDSAAAGGYTLPDAVTATVATWRRTRALEVPAPSDYSPDDAARSVVDTIGSGDDTPDLAALAQRVLSRDAEQRATDQAQQIVALAADKAAIAAVATTADLAEDIIVNHLRPVLEQVYADTRDAAAALAGYGLSVPALITAPAKARNAYAALGELVTRRNVILSARAWVNQLAGLKPEHDERGLFLEFRRALKLVPPLAPTQRIPDLPAPTDPLERILWVVNEGAVAEPWLPTVAEQDAAWWDAFGARVEQARRNHFNAQAFSAFGG